MNFGRCATHLPHDIDRLHGDALVQSLHNALIILHKARVVLSCWLSLLVRPCLDARTLGTGATKTRCAIGCAAEGHHPAGRRAVDGILRMLLCHYHLLIEGERQGSAAEANG